MPTSNCRETVSTTRRLRTGRLRIELGYGRMPTQYLRGSVVTSIVRLGHQTGRADVSVSTRMRRFRPSAVRIIFLAALFTCPAGYGQVRVVLVPMWGWPYAPALLPYGGHWYSPCYPFASCSPYQFQILERRRERSEELARVQQPPVGAQTRHGFPIGRTGGTKTPSDADVQPDYKRSGQIRDQYQKSGDFLPEFLNGRVGPSR
jgi:hypothetical protein